MKYLSRVIFLVVFMSSVAAAQQVVPLVKYAGNFKKVQVSAGGKDYWFLFDTGAGQTLISPELAQTLGKQVYGTETGFKMNGERFSFRRCDDVALTLGGIRLEHPAVGVFDLMSLLPPGFPRLDGVISLRSFEGRVASLDLPAGKLTIETKSSARKLRKKMKPLASRFTTGPSGEELVVHLGARRDGRTYWFLFDTGNMKPVLLSPQTVVEWKLAQSTAAAAGEAYKAELAFGGAPAQADAQGADLIYDGALNFAYISGRTFLLDLADRQVWSD